jgi:hypothetical protein
MATTLATWTIDLVHSSVEFSLDYMGFSTGLEGAPKISLDEPSRVRGVLWGPRTRAGCCPKRLATAVASEGSGIA